MRRLVFSVWALALALALLAGLGRKEGLVLIAGESMPNGIWVRVADDQIGKGDIVTFCPNSAQTLKIAGGGRCPGGYRRVLKPVVASAGDIVVIDGGGVVVNNHRVPGSTRIDASLGAVSVLPFGTSEVGEDEVWVISSHHSASLDSRYYGPIHIEQVISAVQPLFLLSAEK